MSIACRLLEAEDGPPQRAPDDMPVIGPFPGITTLRERVTDELSDYDYDLPETLIATHPAPRRDDSRLMVVDRAAGTIGHHTIRDLPDLLRSGDCLVLNDTRVIPARLLGVRTATGGKWEGLFLETTDTGCWRLLSQCRGKLQPGERITLFPALAPDNSARQELELVAREDGGIWQVRPVNPVDVWELLDRFGTVPLPPYMHRDQADASDVERYQTVYARDRGSVAAPTAGLHFTPELLARCAAGGIERAFVTLHVGIGTFRPIAVEHLAQHVMHAEWSDVTAATVAQAAATRASGGRVVAVGTTTTRALESAARSGCLAPSRGSTNLFIRPPYEFRAIDGLLTNFHLPRSTLLVLVSTFAGRELIREAYATAIQERYRFYSYGDAMLIL